MTYQAIEEYGLIGDMHTAALVGRNGSLDWLCVPYFDSPSVFAALLDGDRGGRFQIAPIGRATSKQLYWPDTNVLVTRFLSADGVGEIRDFMPVAVPLAVHPQRLVRIVKVVRGSMAFRLECQPAFNYARDPHATDLVPDGACFRSERLALHLATQVPLRRAGDRAIARFTLAEGETAVFVLRQLPTQSTTVEPSLSTADADDLFRQTVDYWRRWLAKCTYVGRWREMVHRSALALKLLTFRPTGAIAAAPTCSLPEALGGERNWDYRYTWIRDSAFTLYSLLRIGFREEAAQFMRWLEERCRETETDGSLQIMYGIDGRHTLTEERLDHLAGYRGSSPVRIGNAAYGQFQLDIYGELMDAVYLSNKYETPISYDLWVHLRKLTNWLCDNWQRRDDGIWEVRSGQQNFVYSKLMCWVALDRALRLADKRSFPADRERWLEVRDQIYEAIIANGWSAHHQAFVQHYGSDTLDASVLMMPMVFFLAPNDPRMVDTLAAINRSPKQGGLVSDSLVYRYDSERSPDGLMGREGTFSICTFWLVEALTRAGRTEPAKLEDARLVFEHMLGYANHLGLYAEQIGPTGEALGNFPQAFTHLALISAACNLDQALDARLGR